MKIYRIAVCEDETNMMTTICSLCEDILKEQKIEYRLTPYSSAEALEADLSTAQEHFDLLLLDIQLTGMTGMDFAKKIRLQGNRVSIIFITSCLDYLQQGYSVQPINYLLKPVDRNSLAEALATDWKLNHSPKTVLLRSGTRTLNISLYDIQYIESLNHSIILHLQDEDPVFPLSLSDVMKELPMDTFSRCHNSFLVNMSQIAEITRTWILLQNGKELPIGRQYYKDFQTAFIRYMNQ